MEDFIKNIIVEKKYFELTSSEKQSIQEWALNEEEFDALKAVLLATQAMTVQNESQLSPSVKQRLDDRFAAKYAHKNETAWNKFLIFFFPRDTQFFKKPAFQLVMVALVVALIIPFLWQDNPAQYAMNENRKRLEIEESKSPSLKGKEFQSEESEKQNQDKEKQIETSELNKESESLKEAEYLFEKIESVSSIVVENVIDLKKARSMDALSSPTYDQIDEITEELSLTITSSEKSSARIKDVAGPKSKIETSETLDLLTALY